MANGYNPPVMLPPTQPTIEFGDLALDPPDILVIPVFEDDDLGDVDLDDATRAAMAAARARRELKGTPWEVVAFSRASRPPRVLTLGLGTRDDVSIQRVAKHATAAGLATRQRGASQCAYVVRQPMAPARMQQALAEGFSLAAFDVDAYKTAPREAAPLTHVRLVAAAGVAPQGAAIRRGAIVGESMNLARALGNEPGNALPPRALADESRRACEAVGLSVTVLDDAEIERLGMGLLAGVGRGSAEPPRLVAIEYAPAAVAEGRPVLGLVGKGITFDTGGISIKPAESMDRMKFDMCGAAAVVGAMRAIALLGAPIRVVGVIAAAENMPDGKAIRPGDVLRGASGKTVEINNTDAEGRLVLADALWYAQERGATHLVDVATLTGAIGIALGRLTSGVFASPVTWRDRVLASAEAAGDRMWAMPSDDDYFEAMKSDIADMANAGGRAGGAITAALFLKQFAGVKPWAHLDIAGTAWADEPKPFMPKGPTGVATRTLIELACSAGEW